MRSPQGRKRLKEQQTESNRFLLKLKEYEIEEKMGCWY